MSRWRRNSLSYYTFDFTVNGILISAKFGIVPGIETLCSISRLRVFLQPVSDCFLYGAAQNSLLTTEFTTTANRSCRSTLSESTMENFPKCVSTPTYIYAHLHFIDVYVKSNSSSATRIFFI